jgi:hypothetical protein
VIVGRNTSVGPAMLFLYENTAVGSISVFSSSTAYNTSSDYRLKTNIQPLSDGAERLALLRPVRFNFLREPDGPMVDGFIAHEVAEIVPESVTGEKDAVDPETGEPVYQGIDHSKLVPILVAAVQQLEARIAALEAA